MAHENEPLISGFKPSTLRTLAEKGRADLADQIRRRFDATGDDECRQLYAELCYWAWKALGKEDAPISDAQKAAVLDEYADHLVVNRVAAAKANECFAELGKRGWIAFESIGLPPDAA